MIEAGLFVTVKGEVVDYLMTYLNKDRDQVLEQLANLLEYYANDRDLIRQLIILRKGEQHAEDSSGVG